MSTARQRRPESGFTLFEIAVSVGILAVMILILEGTIHGTRKADRRLGAMAKVTDRGERITYELLDEVNASHKIFSGDTIGDDYLDALELTRFPLLSGARLPLIDEAGRLEPDAAGNPRTGNVILFVRESAAAPALANAGTNALRYVDLYRFVCIYPHGTSRRLILDPPIQQARDLIVWRSVRYANHAQLLDIADAGERRSVVADLYNRFGIEHAWDPNAAVDSAFFAMDGLGTLGATPIAGLLIEEDQDVSAGGQLTYANVQLAPTRIGDFHRRSLMTNDAPATWVPDGLEVKIVGLTGSRRVWMHLVVEAAAGKGTVGVHASTVIASPRDI